MSNSCAALGKPRQTFTGPRGTDPDSLSGQRRIYRKNLLEHPGRAAVYHAIVSNPGIDLAAISQVVLMNRQTLRYHLDLLDSHHRIAVVRERGTTRYFENSGRYGAIEQRVFLHLRSPTAHAILALIRSDPGITQSAIAARIGYSAPTIRWHMHRLLDDEIVTAQRAGRNTRYHLTADGSSTMHRLAAVPCAGA
ncbi:MAG TPA: winged helix-turn-helix transcriptional regulator [Methanoregulaceae archaeon]|nr:winged helix-turn-helix transcriptional regulator [Methanoregulaceae archaeon]